MDDKQLWKPAKWYYYLHTNGDLIGKNPIVFDADPRYFDSPFVKKFWLCTLNDRGSSWRMILEALALGARIERVQELARKWGMDFDDAIEMLKHAGQPKGLQRTGMKIFIERVLGMSVKEFWEKARKNENARLRADGKGNGK